jgi:peptide/nickel transport system substrate-binding protein
MSGNYVVPLFHLPAQWVAYWRQLRHPDVTPLYGFQIDSCWLEDGGQRADTIGRATAASLR